MGFLWKYQLFEKVGFRLEKSWVSVKKNKLFPRQKRGFGLKNKLFHREKMVCAGKPIFPGRNRKNIVLESGRIVFPKNACFFWGWFPLRKNWFFRSISVCP